MIKLLKFIPIRLTLFLIVGIFVGSFYNFQPNILTIIFSILLLVFSVVYVVANKQFNPASSFAVLVYILSFFIGIASITFKNQLNRKQHYTNNQEFSIDKPILGIITVRKVLKPNMYYSKYIAELVQFNGTSSIGKILVNLKRDSVVNQLNVDDKLLIKASFKEIKNPLNPYSFNYKKYLQTQQIYHQIVISEKQFLPLSKTTRSVKGKAAIFREKVNNAFIQNGFKDNELAVINALLLGQRQTITSELQQHYARAGAIHILAISGLHVGIILLVLTFLLKPLHYFKNGKLIASILIVTFLWMYALIAGLSASVVRAVSMFSAVAIGMFLNRPSNVYNTLVISLFFLLLINPLYLFEVGFQLSYVAVFSIVWIQPKLHNLWKPKFWLFHKFWQLFTVSLAAQIGVLPLSIYYFHQFPGLFFLSNLVIIPFLGILLIAGFVIIILSVFEILPQYLAESYGLVIQTLNNFVVWIANQESFIIQNITFSLTLMLTFYVFIVVFFKWVEKKLFYRFVLVFISLIAIQSIVIFEKYKQNATKEFVVFNKSKKNIIGIRNGSELKIYSSIDSLDTDEPILKSYLIGTGISENFKKTEDTNLLKFNEETILVVDSLGIYKFKSVTPSIVVLQHSPKINLERLLQMLHPKLIIADGSNYKSYIEKWEQTCLKKKTPFYNTMQKGAFILNEEIDYSINSYLKLDE